MDGRAIADLTVYEAWCDPFVIFPDPELLWASGYGSAR
jgi:hypothetical protein